MSGIDARMFISFVSILLILLFFIAIASGHFEYLPFCLLAVAYVYFVWSQMRIFGDEKSVEDSQESQNKENS